MATQFIFERTEKKYIVDVPTAEQVKHEIAHFLPRERYNGSGLSFVRSVYFDNEQWKSYFDYRTDQRSRFKLRMRQYGTNGIYTNWCFFELKEKLDFMTFKKRLRLKPKWTRRFLEGADLLKKLAKHNEQMTQEQLIDIYREIREYLAHYDLLPTLEVMYQREAFEGEQRTLRITCDRHLSFKALPFAKVEPIRYASLFPDDQVVIEIKATNEWPDWLKKISDGFDLVAQRFSKYATAVEALFAPGLEPPLVPIEVQPREVFDGTIC